MLGCRDIAICVGVYGNLVGLGGRFFRETVVYIPRGRVWGYVFWVAARGFRVRKPGCGYCCRGVGAPEAALAFGKKTRVG